MKETTAGAAAMWLLVALSVAILAGCKEQNKFAPPPPQAVSVAPPLQHDVRGYLEQTGNTQPVNEISLVARVEGFLSEIDYQDGAFAKRGDTLFVIEPLPYQAKLQQAQASLEAAKAALVLSQIEYDRQKTLYKQDVTAAATLDKARAARDSDQANVDNNQAGVTQAAVNYGYTRVTAAFDGVVSRHLASVGALVGNGTATELATLTQLDPIYVTFNISEQEVLRIRANLEQRRLTLEQINQVPVEVGLMDEKGFPHKGHLDYVAPGVDPSTGTLLVRGIFDNPTRALLPGLFARIRIPTGAHDSDALLVPHRVVGVDQSGSYVLVVNKDDVVEQRSVQLGQTFDDLIVVSSGLKPDDRVIMTTTGRNPPGAKVAPQATTIAVPADLAAAPPSAAPAATAPPAAAPPAAK